MLDVHLFKQSSSGIDVQEDFRSERSFEDYAGAADKQALQSLQSPRSKMPIGKVSRYVYVEEA